MLALDHIRLCVTRSRSATRFGPATVLSRREHADDLPFFRQIFGTRISRREQTDDAPFFTFSGSAGSLQDRDDQMIAMTSVLFCETQVD